MWQNLFKSHKVLYSDWELGTIQNRSMNSMIELLGKGNISYVLPGHSQIIHFFEIKDSESSVKLLLHNKLGVHLDEYKRYYLLKFSIT